MTCHNQILVPRFEFQGLISVLFTLVGIVGISRWLLDLKTVQTPSRKFWLECIHPENSIIIEEDAIIGIWIGIPILRRIVNKRYLQRENVLSTPLIHVNSSSTLGRDRGTRMIESSSENN